jgi:predicted transcriptional regulator
VIPLTKETINFTLRMTSEQKFELDKIAYKEDRTVTNLINMVLKNYIERYNGVKK